MTDEQYYYQQLVHLHETIDGIDTLVKQRDHNSNSKTNPNLQDNIQKYDEALITGLNLCRNLDARLENLKTNPDKKELTDKTVRVNQLCIDLEKVLEYARKVSNRTKAFALFPANKLEPKSLSPNAPQYLQLLQDTRSGLEQLKTDPLQDPGLPELITVIDRLEKQTKAAQINANSLEGRTLVTNTKDHQENFLNARAYLWNNTIEIGNIKRALSYLKDTFKN